MSSDASDVAMIAAAYHVAYKMAVYENLVVGIVYGIYIVFYATAVHILLSRPGFTSSRPRKFLFGITTFMFVLGITILVLETSFSFQAMQFFLDPTLGTEWSIYRANIVLGILSRLMYILSDIICAWRAVVLWNWDKRVVAILLLFILGTTAAAGCDIGLIVSPLASPSYHSIQKDSNVKLGERSMMWIVPTLATNLLSTGLIAWKFWQHRISVRKHLSEETGSVRADRIFAMLIESGTVYCCLWILYLIAEFGVLPETWFDILGSGLLFVSGLYPTLIVILVFKQMSPVEYHSTHSTGMHVTSGPVPHSMPQHVVYRIGREYVSDSDTQLPSAVFTNISAEEKSLSGMKGVDGCRPSSTC